MRIVRASLIVFFFKQGITGASACVGVAFLIFYRKIGPSLRWDDEMMVL